MTTTDLHVVLGASGGAGNAIARALIDSALPVRAVNRSGTADLPSGAELMAADITDPAGLASAISGASVVYLAAQPAYHRWAEEFPAMLEGAIAACSAIDATLVMVDNLYAYGPGHERITEATPLAATDVKGRVRAEMTRRLLDAHRNGELRVVIGQASDYFGPRRPLSVITALAIDPVTGRGALRWMGSLDTPHSVAYLPDIARAYVTLGTAPEAAGRAWILPHGDPVTGAEFLGAVNATLTEPRRISVVSRTMLRLAAPFHAISRESLGVIRQWTEPWIADSSEFESTFGAFATTPLAEAVAATVAAAGPAAGVTATGR